jgi:Zn finger protein HypA/HybF involved in hydrogenase expression
MLHNVSDIYDERLVHLVDLAYNISLSLTKDEGNSWLQQVLNNLLRIQLWDTCLDFIQQRESRVRALMITAGINELTMVNERVLNASLLTVSGATERATVQNWFAEMSSYAWWLPDDIVSLVRRCIAQEAGDCTRIGPTEITAISVQIGEQSKIVEDWVRRIFIGMWNAMPALSVLLVVELIVICMPKRGYVAGLPDYPRLEYSRPAYPQLEAPRKQLKALPPLPPLLEDDIEEIDEEPVTATRRRKLPALANSAYMIVRRPRLLKNI